MLSRKKFIALCSTFTVGTAFTTHAMLKMWASSTNPIPVDAANSPSLITDALGTYVIVDNYNNGHLMIYAYEFTLDASILPSDRHISIFSYRIILNGSLTLPSQNIFLTACEIISTNNGKIDVSGENGKPFSGSVDHLPADCYTGAGYQLSPGHFIIAPPDANNIDVNGDIEDDPAGIIPGHDANGRMNGKNGGNIQLNCLSLIGSLTLATNGGNGSKGKNGTDGMKGCDAQPDGGYGVFAASGMPAGRGAIGSYGGNGGGIVIKEDVTDFSSQITVKANKGLQGDSGDPGSPGAGGRGIVGSGKTRPTVDDSHRPYRTIPGLSTQSPDGHTGKPVEIIPNIHIRDGHDGTISLGSIGQADYYQLIPIDFIKLLMLKAEELYLNSTFAANDVNMKATIDLLNYVRHVSEAQPDSGLFDVNNRPMIKDMIFYLSGYADDGDRKAQWDSLTKKSIGYLGQINLKLDIFGHPNNYAPNLNIDYLSAQYEQSIPLVQGFENFAQSIDLQQTQLSLEKIKNSINEQQSRNNINKLDEDITALHAEIVALDIEIQFRLTIIGEMKSALLADDNVFRAAVESSSNGCNLDKMVHCLTAVVAVASAVYTLGATSVAAFEAVGSVVNDIKAIQALNDIKTTISGIQDLSKKLGDVRQGYTNVQNAYNQMQIPTNQTPERLIGIDTADFDKVIDQFLNLPEANAYKADFHRLVDYVNLTNQKRVEITSLLLAINHDYHDRQIQTDQLNQLMTNDLSIVGQTMTSQNKLALYDLYYNTRWAIIEQIYLQHKALNFQYPVLNPSSYTYSQIDFSSLSAGAYLNNVANLRNLNINSINRSDNHHLIPLNISFNDYPINHKMFLSRKLDPVTNEHYFSFELKIKPPKQTSITESVDQQLLEKLEHVFGSNSWNIKVMGLLANMKCNTRERNTLKIRVTHMGDSLVTTAANFQGQVEFRHIPKTVNLITNVSNNPSPQSFDSESKTNLVGGTLGNGDHTSLGVSPFATWKIDIYETENPSISVLDFPRLIANFKSIDIYYWYYYQTFS